MERQVIRSSGDDRVRGGTVIAGTEDTYIDRLLKLIPTETVAVYLFVDGVVRSGLAGRPALKAWLWIVLALITVGNLLYWRKAGVRDVVQYVILTVAFLVWVFTIGGPFTEVSWREPFMGSVVLGLFTFFIPFIYKGVPEQM